MLPKRNRLPTSFFKEVHALRRKPSRTVRLLSCRACAYSSALPYSRFAVVSSNKNHENIVRRNRFRRRVYTAVGEALLCDVPGWDVILLFQKIEEPDSKDLLRQDMYTLYRTLAGN